MADRDFHLDQMISPTKVSDFIEQYFEQQPFIQSRNAPDYYADLLSLRDVEALVFTLQAPKNPNWIRLVKGGELLTMEPPLIDQRGDLRPSQVVSKYHQGYTIVLNQLQKRWSPISMLCRNLEEFFHASTRVLLKGNISVNLYLTPRNAQGFTPHYDNHDVFILQLEGSKNWSLYNELMPFPIEPLSKISQKRLGKPLHTVHLSQGDVLYIPRGYPHEASTSGDYSLHLTLGIHTYTWAEAIAAVAKADARFRSSLPCRPSDQEPRALRMKQQLAEHLPGLADEERLNSVLEKLTSSYLTDLFPLPGDYFDQINQLDHITLSTVVCKRHGQACQIIREGDYLSVHFPGSVVRYPNYLESVFHYIIEANDFSVGLIPDLLDDHEKLILVRHLTGNGFLKTVSE